MITVKIRRLDDDWSEKKNRRTRGSAADERAAMAALVRKTGGSYWHAKTRAKRPGRGTHGGSGPNASRPRYIHKKDFRDLGEYLIEGNKEAGERLHPDGEGRIEDAFALNLPTADDNTRLNAEQVRDAIEWMGESAALNTRIRASATLHYTIALPPEERGKATPEFWRTIAPRVLENLKAKSNVDENGNPVFVNMRDHQTLFVVHEDAGHPHMHIVVNRVHPITHLAPSPWQDLYALEKLNRQIEKEFGLREVTGRLINPATGEKYAIEDLKNRPRKRAPSKAVQDYKRALGKDRPFSKATSWADLETHLETYGMHLRAEGGGLHLCMDDGPGMKVSSVAGKGNGRRKLEERFGLWNDHQEAKEQGIGIDALRAMRQAEEKRLADEQQAQQRMTELKQRRETELRVSGQILKAMAAEQARREKLETKLKSVMGRPMAITDPALAPSGCTVVSHGSEIGELLQAMTQEEALATYQATEQKLKDLTDALKGHEHDTSRLYQRQDKEAVERTLKAMQHYVKPPARNTVVHAVAVVQPTPLEVDENDQSSWDQALQTVSKMSANELRQQLSATRTARHEVKPTTARQAHQASLFNEGIRFLKQEMKKRNIEIPANPFKPKRSRSKHRGPSL